MNIADSLANLEPVSLEQLDRAQLHDRVESKVLLHHGDVAEVLDRLETDYHVMEHDGERTQWYRTEYFDDPMLRSYHDHHNQKRNRLKARYRTYLNSNITYFEVKQNVDGRTVKTRRRSHPPEGRLWPEDALFFYTTTGQNPSQLRPSLTVEYERLLLVRKDYSERVTIDLNVSYSSEDQTASHGGLAVCEFKQGSLDRSSPAIIALSRRPQMFSKYCMGLASCHPMLRRNRFKKVFLRLEALAVSIDRNSPVPKTPELIS